MTGQPQPAFAPVIPRRRETPIELAPMYVLALEPQLDMLIEVNVLARRIVYLFLVLTGSTLSIQGAETVIGSVKSAEGGAMIRRGAESMPAREGLHLLLNDTLQTSAGGRLGAILQDGTRISLGPNTELKIDQFVYDPAGGKFGLLLRLGRGVMAYISGKIAQFSPGSATVETPVGVLGLRGTHFAVSLEGM